MFELFESIIGRNRITEGKHNFDVKSFIGEAAVNEANKKWSGKKELDILDAAKNGDKSAVNYIFAKCGGMIFKKFKVFTGPNSDFFRKAVMNGEYEDWIAEAYSLLIAGYTDRTGKLLYESPLTTFKASLYKEGDLINKFNYYYGQYLDHVAVKLRIDKASGGMGTWNTDDTGAPIGSAGRKRKGDNREMDAYKIKWSGRSLNAHDDSDHDRGDKAGNYEDAELYKSQKDSGTDMYSSFNPESVMDDIEAEESLKGWRDLVQDEDLNNHDRKVIAAMLRNPSAGANEVATIVDGNTKNHIAVSKAIKKLGTLTDIYNISPDGFAKLLQDGSAEKMAEIIESAIDE